MKPRITTAFLAVAVAGTVLTGFTSQNPLSPRPLKAESACGQFDGLPCSSNCEKECTNGSCCEWRHYYYPKQEL